MKATLATIENVRTQATDGRKAVGIYEVRVFKNDDARMKGIGRNEPDMSFRRTSGHGRPQWMQNLVYMINETGSVDVYGDPQISRCLGDQEKKQLLAIQAEMTALQETVLDYDVWFDTFKPLTISESPSCISLKYFDKPVDDASPENSKLWSFISDNGHDYIVTGYHVVNVISYVYTEKAWDKQYIVKVV